MTPENKKLLMYGGGAFLVGIALYLLFKKKSSKPTPAPDPNKPDDSKKDLPSKVFTKSGTRVRKEPSTSSEILATYTIGKTLTPIDSKKQSDGLWYNVLEQGGWVRSDVVTL